MERFSLKKFIFVRWLVLIMTKSIRNGTTSMKEKLMQEEHWINGKYLLFTYQNKLNTHDSPYNR